jgi:hypothetical protein
VRLLNRPTFRMNLCVTRKKCFEMAIFKDFLEHSKKVGETAIFNGLKAAFSFKEFFPTNFYVFWVNSMEILRNMVLLTIRKV